MGFYQQYFLPDVINLAMRNRDLLLYRKRLLAAAQGRVLEIGIGSGLNLSFFSGQIFAGDSKTRVLAKPFEYSSSSAAAGCARRPRAAALTSGERDTSASRNVGES